MALILQTPWGATLRYRNYLRATASTLALAAATSLSTQASAADPFSWTGFYIGGHGGVSVLDHRQTTYQSVGACSVINLTSDCRFNNSNGAFGAFAGFNVQSGPIVFGIEGDWSSLRVKHSETFRTTGGVNGNLVTVTGGVNWLSTVRGRIGIAFSPTMLYVTGGVAFGGLNSGWTTNGSPPDFLLDHKTKSGWVGGAGVEHAFSKAWLIRGEVLYHDLGRDTGSIQLSQTYTTQFRHTVTTARAGLALRW